MSNTTETLDTSKTLHVVIKQKFDECGNWDPTYVPKAGEVCWIHAPAWGKTIPMVGDGINTLNNLAPVYAHAYDVHDWAKKTEDDFLKWKSLQDMIDARVEQYLTSEEFIIDANYIEYETGDTPMAPEEF